jgi:FlaA1/EpsC-like NDP-sugar epimerase
MGATKQMAESICKAYNDVPGRPDASGLQYCKVTSLYAATAGTGSDGKARSQANPGLSLMGPPSTRFISVRFGNVLGSRGSVLPLFLDQLKYGGPLTVTHKEMKRYFMTMPEAVALVLQASVIGSGGEVLVLDMGEPVSIAEIAEELVRMHGLEPGRDIEITYVGPRPGEKLSEEILTAKESADASKHEKIYIARNGEGQSMEEIRAMLDEFDAVLGKHSARANETIKDVLRKHVRHCGEEPGSKTGETTPEVRPARSGYRQCHEPVSVAEKL